MHLGQALPWARTSIKTAEYELGPHSAQETMQLLTAGYDQSCPMLSSVDCRRDSPGTSFRIAPIADHLQGQTCLWPVILPPDDRCLSIDS